MPTAIITGASRGLGLATARGLADRGWELVLDARDGEALGRAAAGFASHAAVTALAGDVTDGDHRDELVRVAEERGGPDLVIANASTLGASPLPPLASYPLDRLVDVLATNVVASLALVQRALPALRARRGVAVAVTSDAAREPYPGWGGYGASKAALDQLWAVLAAEEPDVGVYAFDPGDLRTAMHQAAFPGEDISDRPAPSTVVPALLHLVDRRPTSGRYRAADLATSLGTTVGGAA